MAVNPSSEWTPEERLAVIARICQRSYPALRVISEIAWRNELILALACEPSDFLELNRSNFKEYFDKEAQ